MHTLKFTDLIFMAQMTVRRTSIIFAIIRHSNEIRRVCTYVCMYPNNKNILINILNRKQLARQENEQKYSDIHFV